ncbi:MAG: peroxidase-related enzyme [Bacteroidetes bacterium]|nr:peroxidase-related enzyme [Bacteroidota bacterium]
MPFIHTISYEASEGELRQAYDSIIGTRGKLAEVHQMQSLDPTSLLAHMELYKAVMFGRAALKRYQREMMAVVVSAANRCRYCVEHHKEALLFYWKDTERVNKLAAQLDLPDLPPADRELCKLARNLTQLPYGISSASIELLKNVGLDDRAVLDAVQVVAYFNFVNRMVLALGVEFSEEEVKGYNY